MSTHLDPFLYAAVPNNPNVMGMAATLTEPVDADVLGEAIEELRERFPYFYVRVQVKDADLVLMPNKLAVKVRKTWEPTLLMSSETNYHICAWKCEGRRVCLEILHVVTDGSGLMPYFKSVLFLYLSKKLGIEFDREGFRLPCTEIPESEVGDPFDSEMLEAIEEPFYKKPEINDFVQLERRGGHHLNIKEFVSTLS